MCELLVLENDFYAMAHLVLGPLTVIFVHTLGLGKLVDFSTGETS